MVTLSVNVDHVATLRQARRANEPDPIHAAALAELGGAQGITVHLREDRRHIQDRDLKILKETIKTPLNMEMAATDEMVKIACEVRPYSSTLVPEKREELTTEGGLDVLSAKTRLKSVVAALKQKAILVSCFIDPVREQIEASKAVGADFVEIHTGKYCELFGTGGEGEELRKIIDAASYASQLNLIVRAGHGLNYLNVSSVVSISEVCEVSIGHSIVARAVLAGMERAVREMMEILARTGKS
ncbi:MAG: pyridoxine 5'-phosphate synthase [Candidatus Eisenbacteria bacterium]|nr:pyridoxine 5'-phosphate synthase [Candidatus Eisenbacteria bacterium]